MTILLFVVLAVSMVGNVVLLWLWRDERGTRSYRDEQLDDLRDVAEAADELRRAVRDAEHTNVTGWVKTAARGYDLTRQECGR